MATLEQRIDILEAKVKSFVAELAELEKLSGEDKLLTKLALSARLRGVTITIKYLHELVAEDNGAAN
ncbi:MAG TPA: hypothetical protein VGD14_01360 [bacterium]